MTDAFSERCAREDEQDRLRLLRASAVSQPWIPRLPDCPPHLLFLCVEKMEDVAGSTTAPSRKEAC
jgi:hypothetical protein